MIKFNISSTPIDTKKFGTKVLALHKGQKAQVVHLYSRGGNNLPLSQIITFPCLILGGRSFIVNYFCYTSHAVGGILI